MKKIKRGTEPYFETLGGRNEIYKEDNSCDAINPVVCAPCCESVIEGIDIPNYKKY
ncbi:hypothetical protein [Bacillus cereus]|uniref:hypothetical protein n=1 Tax=Bacillus cereus TaxID=1396 RepID=UPI00362E0F6A